MFLLTFVLFCIAFFLFFVYRRSYAPTPVLRLVVDTVCENPQLIVSSRQPVPLPAEALDLIFSFYIASILDGFRCGTVRDYRVGKKRVTEQILAVAHCSKRFNRIMRECIGRTWASCGHDMCPSKEYLGVVGRPARCIRIITAEQDCLPLDIDLTVHVMLEIASINYHAGVQWSSGRQQFRRFRCVSAYPRSLRQLEILRSHTPEEEVIRLVSDCCPGLTELRLVRCTMFNDPECWYWRTHTRNQDHDYMKTHDVVGVVEYANRMALLLCGLPQLESIHIGHYLISMIAVYSHRIDHKRYHPITDRMNHVDGVKVFNSLHFKLPDLPDDGPRIDSGTIRLADRALWANPCPQCEREFKKPIEVAERLAAGILVAHLEHLKHVSFANFFSAGRVSPSSWLVGRQQRGPDLYVRTEGPKHPRSRIMQPMVEVDGRWEPPRAA